MDITQGTALLEQQYGDVEDWTGASAAEHGEAVAALLAPFGDPELQLLGLFHAMHEIGHPDAPVPERVREDAARVRCRLDLPEEAGFARPRPESREVALVQLACDAHTLRGHRLDLLDPQTRERARQAGAAYREAAGGVLKDGDLRELDGEG
jgi:hypothetical protein